MALLRFTVNQRFASWFHALWYRTPPGTATAGGPTANIDTTALCELGEQGVLDQYAFGTWSHAWSAGERFGLDMIVEGNTALGPCAAYRSLQADNIGHELTDTSWWEPVLDGLGADDAFWSGVPGIPRHSRVDSVTGLVEGHMMASPVVNVSRWNVPLVGGQYAITLGGVLPTVRQSATSDTCYYAECSTGADEGGEYWEVWLYRVVDGVTTEIGYNTGYGVQFANQVMVYAHDDRIGVAIPALPTSGAPAYLHYHFDYDSVLEVTDTAIPLTDDTRHIGARSAGKTYTHEWYGGSYLPYAATYPTDTTWEVLVPASEAPGTFEVVSSTGDTASLYVPSPRGPRLRYGATVSPPLNTSSGADYATSRLYVSDGTTYS